MASEAHWLVTTARDAGMGVDAYLSSLWSSDVTEMRAAAVVSAAQSDIAEEYRKAEEKKHRRRGRRR